jgi:hypothetical protein
VGVLAVALCEVVYGLARPAWFYGDAGVAEEATGVIFFAGMPWRGVLLTTNEDSKVYEHQSRGGYSF